MLTQCTSCYCMKLLNRCYCVTQWPCRTGIGVSHNSQGKSPSSTGCGHPTWHLICMTHTLVQTCMPGGITSTWITKASRLPGADATDPGIFNGGGATNTFWEEKRWRLGTHTQSGALSLQKWGRHVPVCRGVQPFKSAPDSCLIGTDHSVDLSTLLEVISSSLSLAHSTFLKCVNTSKIYKRK